jgi:hypothetical protein
MSDLIRYFVAASRVTRAGWDSGEPSGDIYCSYSADTIAQGSKVRKPFDWEGSRWITIGLCFHEETCVAEAYRLIPKPIFAARPTTYWGKTRTPEDAEAAREDPMGFYHGMTVTQGRETFVLVGPPATFEARPPTDDEPAIAREPLAQLSLL